MEMRSLLLAAVSAGMMIIGTAGAPAADLSPIRVAPPPPPPPAPVANWSGHYAGVQLGWANVRGQIDGGTYFQTPVGGTPANAFLLGGKIGHNLQARGPFVIGAEGDVSGILGNDVFCATGGCETASQAGGPQLSFNVHGVGSLVGRLGWAPSNRALFYGLGGFATGAVQTNDWYAGANHDGSVHLFTGWTAGLGMDVMVLNNISLGIEGRYYDLGNKTLTDATNFTWGWHPTMWTLSIGAKHYF